MASQLGKSLVVPDCQARLKFTLFRPLSLENYLTTYAERHFWLTAW
jgi:hypothetical protein